MNRFIKKKNNLNLGEIFPQSNIKKKLVKNKRYSDVLSTLIGIFEKYGKSNILVLLKLRKIWFKEIDSFLSKNSYPRNISKKSKFVLDSNFIRDLKDSKLKPDLLYKLENMNGKSFLNSKQLFDHLKKNLYRSLEKYEMELLKNKFQFNYTQNILHLTVYDGSISYAIHSESKNYIRIFNKLLPDIIFDEIKCHVGSIEKIQMDQSFLSLLVKKWRDIAPKEIQDKCIPAFFHRTTKNYLILVLYVSSKKYFDYLKLRSKEDELLMILQKKNYDLKGILKKIKFVLMEGVDLEKIRFDSLIGESFMKSQFDIENFRKDTNANSLISKLSVRDEFAKLSRKLKSK